MSGVSQASAARPFTILRTSTPPSTTDEETLLDIAPARGLGTGRVWLLTDVAGTLRIYQKPRRLSATSLQTFRVTDTISVAASATSMVPLEFTVRDDYVRITFQATGSAPTTFNASAVLYP